MFEDWDWWSWSWSFVMNHLWQATVFSGFAVIIVLLLKRAPARLRHTIWTVAALKFVLPSTLIVYLARQFGFDISELFLSMAWATGNPVWLVDRQHQMFHVAGSSNATFSHAKLLFVGLGVLWFSGTATLLFLWLKRKIRFYKALKQGTLLTSGREFEILEGIRARLSLKREIRLVESSEIAEPGVWGIWKPIIVFPDDMAPQLRDSELEAVLLHEMAHIARYDNLFSNVQMVICSVFWFHPIVWWIDRQMLAEREAACDDRVIELGSTSKVYVSSLIKVLQFGLGFKMAGVSCAGGSNLHRRIQHIVSKDSRSRLSVQHRIIVGAMLSALLAVSVAAVDIGDCERDALTKEYYAVSTKASPVQSCPNKGMM